MSGTYLTPGSRQIPANSISVISHDQAKSSSSLRSNINQREESNAASNGNRRRVQRACIQCRKKKLRCSGPSVTGNDDCIPCRREKIQCEWPIARRRKSAILSTQHDVRDTDGRSQNNLRNSQSSLAEGRTRSIGSEIQVLPSNTAFPESLPSCPTLSTPSQSLSVSSQFSPDAGANLPAIDVTLQMQSVATSHKLATDPVDTHMTIDNQVSIDALLGLGGHTPERSSPYPAHQRTHFTRIDETGPGVMVGEAISEDTVRMSAAGRRYIKLDYRRFSGNTAIHPGINRTSVKLLRGPISPRDNLKVPPHNAVGPLLSTDSNPFSGFTSSLFDEQTGLPSVEITRYLIDLFDDKLGQHFPGINATMLKESLGTKHISGFLILAICAVAARFSPQVVHDPASGGNIFMAKVQDMVVPLLRCPTLDTIAGLLLLAWAEFGQNSEAGFWQFAGMAIRMAIDLGLYKDIDAQSSHRWQLSMVQDLFWSTFLTDRLLSLNLGRLCSISADIVEIPLPSHRLNSVGLRIDGSEAAHTFLVQIMEKCGRIGDMLNGNRGITGTFMDHNTYAVPMAMALRSLQGSLVELYNSAPPHLTWSPSNFKAQRDLRRGGIYLSIHLWANAMLSLTHHPALLHKPRGSDTPLTQQLDTVPDLSLAASRNVCECLLASSMMDDEPLICTPQVTQALYFAGLAFAYQIRSAKLDTSSQSTSLATNVEGSSKVFMAQLAKQNLQTIIASLDKLSRYWAGAGYVRNILEQRANGRRYATINFASSSDTIETFISLPPSSIPDQDDSGAVEADDEQSGIKDGRRFESEELNQFFSPTAFDNISTSAETDSYLWQTLLTSSSTEGFVLQPFYSNSVDTGLSAPSWWTDSV